MAQLTVSFVVGQANYQLQQCYYLRMYPDHTCLLGPNEAFLPLKLAMPVEGSDEATEVIAMRVSSTLVDQCSHVVVALF
jgi:hypothetical protein